MSGRAPALADAVLHQPLLPAPVPPPPRQAEGDEPSVLDRIIDGAEDLVEDIGPRLARLQVDSRPSLQWLTGAVGASMFASGMAYSVRQGGNDVERKLAQTLAVSGAGLYFAGVKDLLVEAQACRNGAGVIGGALATAAAAAVLAGSMMLASAAPAVQTSGLVVLATGIHGTANKLTDAFLLAYHKLGHSASAAAYTGSPYVSVMIGVATVAAAATLASAVTLAAGKLGVTTAMVAACGAGFSACFATCFDILWQLWAEFRLARQMRAEERGAQASGTRAAPGTV